MRTTMVILLICALVQTTAFGELTKHDLEEIQKVIKEEISDSEQRTSIKLTEINSEIKVIKTDIQGVKDRLGDTHGLVIAVIALIGVTIIIASALTYAAGKLGSALTEMQKVDSNLEALRALVKETNKLIEQDTAENKETNNLLSEYTKNVEEQNAFLEHIQAKIEELATRVGEATDEPSNDPIAHAPAD